MKSKPSIITYRSNKNFDNKEFVENLYPEIEFQSIYLEKNGIDASHLSVARLRISTHLTCDTCVFIKSSIYNDKKSSFDELLSKDSTVSIHHQNIQKLGIKMFEAVKVGNPEIVNVILPGLRTFMSLDKAFFLIPIVNTVYRGAESVRIFDLKIWNLIPNEIKCL